MRSYFWLVSPWMPALGHKRTFCDAGAMSALPPKADMCDAKTNVRFVPITDMAQRSCEIARRTNTYAAFDRKEPAHASEHALGFLFSRQASLRRQLVYDLRQIFGEALEQVIARHASLGHERVDLFRSKSTGQIVRRYCLVGSGADPRIDGIALAALLKLLEQVAQATAQDASSGTCCEQAA